MSRSRHLALLGALVLLALTSVVSACGGAPVPTVSGSIDPSAPRIDAKGLKFVQASVTVPAGRPFRLVFDNQENLPHNVAILDGANTAVFTGAILNTTGTTTYDVPALAAGQYGYICSVHPEMKGTMTAQ